MERVENWTKRVISVQYSEASVTTISESEVDGVLLNFVI